MKKIAILIFLIFVSPVWADLNVPPEDHIQNTDRGEGGLCSWASLETLGRVHGWAQLKGLMDKKKRTDTHANLIKELETLKVKFKSYQATESEHWYFVYYEDDDKNVSVIHMGRSEEAATSFINAQTKQGSYWVKKKSHWKIQFLLDAVKNDLGAAVSIDGWEQKNKKWEKWRHMLIVSHIDDNEVWFVDSNYSPGKIHKMPLNQFLDMWCGFAIVINKQSLTTK